MKHQKKQKLPNFFRILYITDAKEDKGSLITEHPQFIQKASFNNTGVDEDEVKINPEIIFGGNLRIFFKIIREC